MTARCKLKSEALRPNWARRKSSLLWVESQGIVECDFSVCRIDEPAWLACRSGCGV